MYNALDLIENQCGNRLQTTDKSDHQKHCNDLNFHPQMH
jgi:hypothetical protein